MRVKDRVSWTETYKTSGDVIAQRTVWGTIIGLVEKAGDMDGFAIKGTYARVIPEGGGSGVYLLTDHLTSIVKAQQ